MEQQILVGIQIGNITCSFHTDEKGSNVKSAIESIKKILNNNATLFKHLKSEDFAKLRTVTFTSRKVSQALGLLFRKRVLGRVGSKGDFRYVSQ